MTEFERMQEFSKGALIAELEKVRSKIIKKANSGQWSEPTIYGMQKAVFIIDNELSELKEESEKENKQGVLDQIAEEQKTLSDTTKAWSDYIEKHGDIY